MNTKKKVLIVDDIERNRTMFKTSLEHDFEVLEASSGQGALDLILKDKVSVDAIILDIIMPEVTGFDVITSLKWEGLTDEIPIFVITTDSLEEAAADCISEGAYDVIRKPFNKKLLLKRLHNAINVFSHFKLKQGIIERSVDDANLTLIGQNTIADWSELDKLTGLFNQEAFIKHVEEALRDNPDKNYSILRFDVNNFKLFNDAYGRQDGDSLLRIIAEGCKSYSLGNAIFSRFEMDHFVCLIEQEPNLNEDVLSQVESAARIIHPEYNVIINMGVYNVHDKEISVQRMCDHALMALRAAKKSFTSTICYFTDEMLQSLYETQEIIDEMSTALEERHFQVYLQPQYNQITMTIYGAEALVRWIHPDKGIISPGKFIPIFERNGFITKLDLYVFEEACKLQRSWIDSVALVVPISVNISRYNVRKDGFIRELVRILKNYHLEPKYINIEITESAYMDNQEALLEFVDGLHAVGFTVEMDDFGSGYSSLNSLKDIPVDVLKLDLRFLHGSVNDERGACIISSVIHMAHSLHIPVIAEGVETREQLEYLRSFGCSYIQGYYFARPMPANEFEEFVKSKTIDVVSQTATKHSDITTNQLLKASNDYFFKYFFKGVAIIELTGGQMSLLRANDAFYREIGKTSEEFKDFAIDLSQRFSKETWNNCLRFVYNVIITKGEDTYELQSLEVPGELSSVWLRAHFKYIEQRGVSYTLLVTIENISDMKKHEIKASELSRDFDALSDSIPGGIIHFAYENGKFILVKSNEAFAKVLGYSYDEFQTLSTEEILVRIHPDDKKIFTEYFQEDLSADIDTFEYNYRVRCKDETYKWIRFCGKLNYFSEEAKYGIGVLLDMGRAYSESSMTSMSQARNESQPSQISLNHFDSTFDYSHLLETLKGGIFKYSRNKKRFTYVTKEFLEILGLTRNELRTKYDDNFDNLILPIDRDLIQNKFRGIPTSANTKAEDFFRIRMMNGLSKWVRAIGKEVQEASGDYVFHGILLDYDDEKRSQIRSENATKLNELLETFYPGGVAQFRVSGNRVTISSVSSSLLDRVGYTMSEANHLMSSNNLTLIHPDDRAFVSDIAHETINTGEPADYICRLISKDGRVVWLDVHLTYHNGYQGGYLYAACHDISAQKALEGEKEHAFKNLQTLIAAIPGGVSTYEVRPNGALSIQYMSDGAAALLGLSRDEFSEKYGDDPTLIVYEPDLPIVKRSIVKFARSETDYIDTVFRIKHANGTFPPLHLHITRIGEAHGNPVLLAILLPTGYDSFRAELLEGSIDEANLDPLTQCYNRRKLESYIDTFTAKPDTKGSFFMIDLDFFKDINDNFGHSAGDEYLKYVADLIKTVFRRGDMIARLGGDEFVVFMPDTVDISAIKVKARQLEELAFKELVTPHGEHYSATLSVGIALYPQDGKNYAELYDCADEALYYSKHSGRNISTLFSEINQELIESSTEDLLRRKTSISGTDAINILESMNRIAMYVIRESDHRILYFNKAFARYVPNINLGDKCHEIWPGSCEHCPLPHLETTDSVRKITYGDSFGREVEVYGTKIMWKHKVPAVLIGVYPRLQDSID